MRILITGDRKWNNATLIRWVLSQYNPQECTIVHGGAKGADSLAGLVARQLGFKVEVYPANWKKYGRAAGPVRNNQMLDTDPDVVLAFHPNLKESKGTAHCVREARKRSIEVKLYG